MAESFRLYNTLTRKVEPFVPLRDGHVGLYVCGMTVYDRAHVGHARAMVVFDGFVRYLEHRGWNVQFVRNFTDVDDKIIHRAAQLGVAPLALAEDEIDAFRRDVAALGLRPPSVEPRVTQSIASIVTFIGQLIDAGHAYCAEGSVWFAVDSCAQYGALSHQDVSSLVSSDSDSGKRAARDFALWKAVKAGEVAWQSPWGLGRPGWHIECSAMARDCLGATIDIHGGGLDLVFPHHENEVAQSECANRVRYANYWMHNGLLTVATGQKMGKSLGNAITIERVVEQFPAEAVRLYYLQSHYRSHLPWSDESLSEALGMLARLYDAREVAEGMQGSEDADAVATALGAEARTVLEEGRAFAERFHAALDDDFNTNKAVATLFSLARAVNRFAALKKAATRGGPVVAPALRAFALVNQALGLMALSSSEFEEEVKRKRLQAVGLARDEVEALVQEREGQRREKRWAEADELRRTLNDKGIAVMDSPQGARWRVIL
jgi:cysteinyl-tRNA synthetase